MERLGAGEWRQLEGKDFFVELPSETTVQFEVRCQKGCVLSAVTTDGELVYLDQGSVARFSGALSGFKGLQVSPAGPFACRYLAMRTDTEVDPTPAVMHVSAPVDPVQAAVQEAIRAQLWALKERGMLEDDEVEELLKEIEEDELEFDEGPDEFGLGHTELPSVFQAPPVAISEEAPVGEQSSGSASVDLESDPEATPEAREELRAARRKPAAKPAGNTPT